MARKKHPMAAALSALVQHGLVAVSAGLLLVFPIAGPAAASTPAWHVETLIDEWDSSAGVVGATVVQPGLGLPEDPYFFSIGDGQLLVSYLENGRWVSSSLGMPSPTTSVARGVGAITGQQYAWEAQRPFAFVIGSDSRLWLRTRSGDVWTEWADHGRPPNGTAVVAAVGAVAVHDSPSAAGRPYVFIVGADGHLWMNWWNGARWMWDDRGVPPNSTLTTSTVRVGVTITQPVAEGSEHPQVFLLDAGRNLRRHGWTGSGWEWTNYGTPPAVVTSGIHGLGVVNDNSLAYRTTYASAYVGVNNLVYEYRLPTTGAGQWVNRSGITGTTYATSLGVINPRTAYGDRLPRLFLAPTDVVAPVSINTWQATGWTWEKVTGTSVIDRGPWNTGDAVAATRDPNVGVDTPYVFYWSDKNRLTVAWMD